MNRVKEAYRRLLHAKARGEKAVYLADLYPEELMSAGMRSVALLERIDWAESLSPEDLKEVENDFNWDVVMDKADELRFAIKRWRTFFGL